MIKQGRKDLSQDVIDKLIRCFEQFKAEDDERLDDDSVFVRTEAFVELVARQETRVNTVLLGRKGDGKTALLRRLAHDLRVNGDKPNGERKVELFHQIDMEETYFAELINQFQLLSERIRKNYPHIPNEQIAKKLWTKYLVLSALQVASQAIRDRVRSGRLNADEQAMADLQAEIASELGIVVRPHTADVSQSFVRYLSGLLRRISLSDRSLAATLSDDEAQLQDPLQALRDLPEVFQAGAGQIGSSRLHLTIALDRFDDFIDRLVSNDLSTTRQLRRHFLHGLVSALYELRKHQEYGWLRVIASLPEDLVVDLDLREIASHKRMLFVHIAWTVPDLRNVLDHRVASVLAGATWGDLFPFQVSNANRKVQRKEAASDYLIRHTTRRPRELMAHALSLFLHLRATGRPIDSKEMNRVIAKTNREIVDSQVIPEWQTVLPALKTFVERMHRSEPRTVFSYAELQQWGTTAVLVRGTLPDDAHVSDDTRAMMALSSLYRIGMVGFRVRRTTGRPGYLRQGDNDWARYVYSYSGLSDPIGDVTALLLSPKLHEVVDLDQGKAVRALLAEAHQAKYDIALCFAPMFFESLSADHDFTFIVDETVLEMEA